MLGSNDYYETKHWVYKLRWSEGKVACDVLIYVDYLRNTGCTREEAWVACRKVASTLRYLGVQDAPRKRRDATKLLELGLGV